MTVKVHGNSKHGFSGRRKRHELYATWANMCQRCTNTNHPSYKNYGGRGIKFFDTWKLFEVFLEYVLNELGPKPDGMTLDRKDNSKDYIPGNLRWASRVVQNSNRRNNIKITAFGKCLLLSEWAIELNIPYSTLKDRHSKQGLRGEALLSTESRRVK